MKTNKILAIGLLSVATMLTAGCSDSFLEVENPTGEPLEDYYTTQVSDLDFKPFEHTL